MKIPAVFATSLLLLLAACGGAANDEEMVDDTQAIEDPCPSVAGSWELVEIRDNALALSGDFESDPNYQESPTLKILNDTHWMFIRQSADQFVHSQGGRYSLEPGGFYTEYVEYSAIVENIGQSFAFECRLEGDSLWHHVGGQGDTRYDEIWRRVR